jgi:structural maintenance of chromosome 1
MAALSDFRLRIELLTLTNFKSFSGTHTIGPFIDFTAVIGPNGGGKSNIMDAISFVLGAKSQELRAGNLRDLINKADSEVGSPPTKPCHVTLHLMQDQQEIVLSRSITSAGGSEYFINDERCPQNDYNDFLETLNIISKIKNYQVFQGQVDSLAMKSGKELTAIFEKISGSEDLVEAYTEAKFALEQTEDEVRHIANKLSYLKGDRKKLKEQKSNAENFERLTTKLKQQQIKYHLMHFAKLEKTLEKVNNKVQDKQAEVQDLKSQKELCIGELRECQLSIKEANEKLINVSEGATNRGQLLLSKRPQLARVLETIDLLQKRVGVKRDQISSLDIEKQRGTAQLQELDAQAADIKAQIQRIIATQIDEISIQMTSRQKESYLSLKKEAALRTYRETKEQSRIQREQNSKQSALTQCETSLSDKKATKSQLEASLSTLARELQDKELELREGGAKLEKMKTQYAGNSKDYEDSRGTIRELRERLVKMEEEYRSYETLKSLKRENKAEIALLNELKRDVPGYMGKLGELLSTIQTKYNQAFSAALGGSLQTLVVDNSETASGVSSRLKKHSLNKELLVMENMPDFRVNDQLRSQVKQMGGVLLCDVLKFEADLDKAVTYFAGNKVVVDSIDMAERIKAITGVKLVVTLDGVTVKGGIITSATAGRRSVFEGNAQAILKEIEATKAQLSTISSRVATEQRLNSLRFEISSAESNLAAVKLGLEALQERFQESHNKLSLLISDIDLLEQKRGQCAAEYEAISKRLNDSQLDIESINDNVFRDFLGVVGAKSLRELEGRDMTEAQKLTTEMHRLKQDYAKLKWQGDAIDVKSCQQSISSLEASIADDSEQIERLLAQAEGLHEEIETLSERSVKIKEEENEYQQSLEQYKGHYQSLKGKSDRLTKELSAAQKVLTAEERDYETFQEQKRQSIEDLMVKHIEVPLVPNLEPAEVDFTKLDGVTLAMSESQLEEEMQRVSSQIEKDAKQMEELGSSGKCQFNPEKFEEATAKISEASTELDLVTARLTETKARFQDLKEQRKTRFLETFKTVADNINKVYKEMTKSSKNYNYGGNAMLYVEDSEEPYNGGVVYSPTPPGKRCMYEMDQLSGGEKTMAALSLLFAMHIARTSPFFVLDEVDAFLDWENCHILLNFLQTLLESGTQLIVISHKEEFYSNADSLIGTTFVPSMKSSKTFSLDLRSKGPRRVSTV